VLKRKKITVIYNRVGQLVKGMPNDLLADDDTVVMAQAVADALKTRFASVSLFELNEKNIKKLPVNNTDCFFNLCGGIGDMPQSEHLAVQLLEESGVPYTGSSAEAVALTTDKVATKEIFTKYCIPTPAYYVSQGADIEPDGIKLPVMVKPVAQDCSLGISQKSVLRQWGGLKSRVEEVAKHYGGDVLVEEYISGREIRMSVLGNGSNAVVLPASELVFGKSYNHKFKIFDFAAKWLPETINYQDTYAVANPKLTSKICKLLADISLLTYQITGCHGYARIDIRLSPKGIPFVLEVNANPAIGPNDALVTSARSAGISYPELLERIVQLSWT